MIKKNNYESKYRELELIGRGNFGIFYTTIDYRKCYFGLEYFGSEQTLYREKNCSAIIKR